MPTGKTPRKRQWEFDSEWDIIHDRADALKRRRKQAEIQAVIAEPPMMDDVDEELPSPDTQFVEYAVPLPVEEEDEEMLPVEDDDEDEEEVAVAPIFVPEPEPEPEPLPAPRLKAPSVAKRRPTAPAAPVAASKTSGIARVSRRVVSSGGVRGPGALTEKSNASGRRRGV